MRRRRVDGRLEPTCPRACVCGRPRFPVHAADTRTARRNGKPARETERRGNGAVAVAVTPPLRSPSPSTPARAPNKTTTARPPPLLASHQRASDANERGDHGARRRARSPPEPPTPRGRSGDGVAGAVSPSSGDRHHGAGAAERPSETAALRALVDRVRGGEVEAAREVRRLTRASARHRRKLAAAVEPLVAMLRSGAPDAGEAALLALLNLAVRDERNKIRILDAGALEPLLGYLQSSDLNLQEYAAAAILTLSASSTNKPIISASGAIPLLVKVLKEGNPQAKNDAVMALYNLSTISDNLQTILSVQPIPPLLELLRGGKRSSKTADKCCALLESLLAFDQGRVALTSEEGGVLTIVEVLEEGSLQGREHAVGALLTMCESDRSKYRDPILNEGVIPGLLELTAHGTPKSRVNAHALLDLLRNSAYSRSKLQPNTLENIVSNIASQIDGEDRGGKTKKMLAEMVKVSMEQSLRHLQRRASFA